MSVVFDTNVLISSTLWNKSASQKLLFKLIDSGIKIYTSKEIIQEYSKVINRDFDYSEDEIVKIMNSIIPFLTSIGSIEKFHIIKDDLKEKIDLVIADLKDVVKIASIGGELKDSTASARIILGKD